jgi:hypothetical protein
MPRGAPALVATLGVHRRPQTTADRASIDIDPIGTDVEPRLTRLVRFGHDYIANSRTNAHQRTPTAHNPHRTFLWNVMKEGPPSGGAARRRPVPRC